MAVEHMLCMREIPDSLPKKSFDIVQNANGEVIGVVRWNRVWGAYGFIPEHGAMLDEQRLREITDYIKALMFSRTGVV